MMNIISSSYGNDSIALIQWSYENKLDDVIVVYIDTKWAAPKWDERVEKGENFARNCGFDTLRLSSMGMEELVRMKKAWPGNGVQFCTMFLKGLPFLKWVDEIDPKCQSTVLIGKRRSESRSRADTSAMEISEYHGNRLIWHPLFKHDEVDRNELLDHAGFAVLPHRSQECSPCVNANRGDLMLLTQEQIEKVSKLEVEIAKSMFRPKRFGALGIYGVMTWAKYGRKRNDNSLDPFEDEGCGSPFGCRL